LSPNPGHEPHGTHRRLRRTIAPLALAALVAGVLACGHTEEVAPEATTTTVPVTTTTTPATTSTVAPPPPGPPAWSATAVPRGSVQGYDAPGGAPTQKVTNTYYDIPTTLPVIEQAPGWLHVRLAPKPNGSTSWVRAADVTTGSTPWRIVINLATSHLQLFNAGEQVLDAPVGIGLDRTPTATGDFFVTHLQKPPSAGYGPFVMVTSGHSNVLQTWEGFPDGILAIHGPIGSDAAIGTTGAKISNGCIRMHVKDQEQLARVVPGSPVQIVDA
jgi:lipoprotein-anchoring transpeptidase ErfK/SrfK